METENISTKVDTSYKQIIQLSLPIWLSIMITQISFYANTYFLDKVGNAELAANGVAGIFYMVLTMTCVGLNSGVQIILSRKAGQEDKVAYGKIFSNSFSLGLFFTIILMALGLLIGPYLFKMQVHNKVVATLSISFLTTRIFGLPFYFLQQLGNQFFISTKNTKYIVVGMVLSTITNVVLDYVLIAGNWGFPKLGIQGAAIAGIIADFVFMFTSYVVIYVKKLNEHFNLSLFKKIDFDLSKSTLALAMPVILQYMFSIGSWELFFIYIEHLGEKPAAITQILRSIFGLVGGASWAYAATCNSMVSNVIGQGRHEEVIGLIKKVATLSFLTCLPLGILYLLFPAQALGFYTKDPLLIAMALAPSTIVVFANFLLSISTVIFNGVLGTGNTKYNMLIELIAIVLYIVYIYYVIELKHLSLSWAWGSEFLYWISLFVMSVIFFKKVNWQVKKI